MKCFVSYIQPELKTLLQTFIKKKKIIVPTNRKFMLESPNIIFFFKILFIFWDFPSAYNVFGSNPTISPYS